jgi:hypothetical protein
MPREPASAPTSKLQNAPTTGGLAKDTFNGESAVYLRFFHAVHSPSSGLCLSWSLTTNDQLSEESLFMQLI